MAKLALDGLWVKKGAGMAGAIFTYIGSRHRLRLHARTSLMRFVPSPRALPLVLSVSLLACSSSAGGDGESSESGTETGQDLEGALWPLADGADWTYVELSGEGQVMNTDHVVLSSTQFDGAAAFWAEEGSKRDTLREVDGVIERVLRERVDGSTVSETVSYEPGLVMVDASWRR